LFADEFPGANYHVLSRGDRRLGWNEGDLVSRHKSDPGKLGMGERLRHETTLTLKAIARRVQLGTSRSAPVRLHEWIKSTAATAESRPTK
jgi:hypothetical protein